MVATAITGGVQAATGIAGGISKFFEGRKMQRNAQTMIDNFEWNDLKNVHENQQVSTLGADLQREENARNNATSINALQNAGTRGLVGGLGRVQAQNNLSNRQIAANLDEQQKQIDYATAEDNANIRGMIEQRQTNELQGYGQMLSTGMGMKYGGIGDIINGLGAGAQAGMTATSMMGKAAGAAGAAGAATTPLVQGAATGGLPVTNPQNYKSSFPAPNYSAGFGTSGMGYWGDNFINNFSQNFSNFKNRPY